MTRNFRFPTSFGLGSRPAGEMRRAYDPVLRNQCDLYFRGTGQECRQTIDSLWDDLLNEKAELPPAASEAQFVLHLIREFFKRAGVRPQASAGQSLKKLEKLLEGFSIYRRKCAFLLLSGYPKDWAGTLLNVGTVQIFNTLEDLQARWRGELPSIDAGIKLALQDKAPKDPEALSRFEALIEGVLHWEEKQELEEKVAQRLDLLETLVMLEEIRHFLARNRDRQEAVHERVQGEA